MPKLSIIVPAYKTGKYIDRCVQSILSQTFTDFELVLIDDGSPDKSSEMCDNYCLKDNRVKLVHKTNSGVATGRNNGLDIAEGEYITFVDSDDWIEPQMYEKMLAKSLEYGCDVVMCDCTKDFPDHSEIYSHAIRPGFYDYGQLKREYYPHLLMMENIEYPPTISNCLCIFRQTLTQNSVPIGKKTGYIKLQQQKKTFLRYVDGVRFSEDLLFGAQMMYRAKSFYYMKDETYYHYCMNPTSATHTPQKEKWEDYLKLYREAEYYFSGETFDFRKQLDYMLLFFVYNALGDIKKANICFPEKKKEYLSILQNENVKEMFSRLSIIRLSISWKLMLLTLAYKYRIGLLFILKKM